MILPSVRYSEFFSMKRGIHICPVVSPKTVFSVYKQYFINLNQKHENNSMICTILKMHRIWKQAFMLMHLINHTSIYILILFVLYIHVHVNEILKTKSIQRSSLLLLFFRISLVDKYYHLLTNNNK